MTFADGFWFGLGRIAAEAAIAGGIIVAFGIVAAVIIVADARRMRRWNEGRESRSGKEG